MYQFFFTKSLLIFSYVRLSGSESAQDFSNSLKYKNGVSENDSYKQNLSLYSINEESGNNLMDLSFLYTSLEVLQEGQCKTDLKYFFSSIMKQEPWAMKMFDSSVKFPTGLLYGNNYELGNFDECINNNQEASTNLLVPQYCLVDLILKNSSQTKSFFKKRKRTRNTFNSTIHWAFCVPASCNTADLKLFLSSLFDNVFKADIITIDVNESFCYYETDTSFTTLEITYGCLVGLFLLFVLVSTTYHVIHIYKKMNCTQYFLDRGRKEYSVLHELTIGFSMIRNAKKIFEVKTKNNDLNLDCISGMKAISMSFILAGHALIFLVSFPVTNVDFHEVETGKVQNAVFLNNPLLVDSFLLISGFLMSRLLLLELEKRKGKINFFIVYLFRYIRLTPAYLVVIGFYCTFLIRLNSGPLWKSRIGLEQERCKNSWWTNILYINNYVNTDNLCMFQSWYLSVDTQLFMSAPLILLPLWKFKKTGLSILGFLLAVTCVVPFYYTYSLNLDPTLMIYAPEIIDLSSNFYFKNAYIRTHMRANSYLFGIMFGYLVHKQQESEMKLSLRLRILGTVTAIFCGASSLFSVAYFYMPNQEYSVLVSAFYCSAHRMAWSFAVGWTIFVCVVYNNGIVNQILSWKAFAPFAKLTYCAYLVNGFIELYNYGSVRIPMYLSINSLGMEVAAHLVATYVIAFVLCLLFESPIHNIEKILLKFVMPEKPPTTR